MNQSGSYSVSKKELENAENQYFLLPESSKNGFTITPKSITRTGSAATNFIDRHSVEPVRLTPAWEDNNLSNDELNFKNLTMDVANLEQNPPKDRKQLVFLILILYGIGILMPWNMFINARGYFVDYKLSKHYTGVQSQHATYFMSYLGFFSQIPNLIFNWINIFVPIGGDISKRIIWSIFVEVIMFLVTIILAMVDSKDWPEVFFWLTMITVIIINMASGIFQNTIYGMGAKLPSRYSGAILLGANISGAFVSTVDILSILGASSERTAAIYYFITALIVLLACFDIYFALPLNRFYRYHEYKSEKNQEILKLNSGDKPKIPYGKVFKQASPQLFNLFFVFLVSLAIFPDMMSGIKKSDPNFFIPDLYYSRVLCFLSFNTTAMIGSLLTNWVKWPKAKYLVIFVVLRVLFIPFFFFCNFQPENTVRNIPVLINNDYVYWIVVLFLGLSAGYLSSLALMYNSEGVEPGYAQTAGMFGGAVIITGIFCGVLLSTLFPTIIKAVPA